MNPLAYQTDDHADEQNPFDWEEANMYTNLFIEEPGHFEMPEELEK